MNTSYLRNSIILTCLMVLGHLAVTYFTWPWLEDIYLGLLIFAFFSLPLWYGLNAFLFSKPTPPSKPKPKPQRRKESQVVRFVKTELNRPERQRREYMSKQPTPYERKQQLEIVLSPPERPDISEYTNYHSPVVTDPEPSPHLETVFQPPAPTAKPVLTYHHPKAQFNQSHADFVSEMTDLINRTTKYKAVPVKENHLGFDIRLMFGATFTGVVRCIDGQHKVAASVVREVGAVRQVQDVKIGIVMTHGWFDEETKHEASKLRVRLVDGKGLTAIASRV